MYKNGCILTLTLFHIAIFTPLHFTDNYFIRIEYFLIKLGNFHLFLTPGITISKVLWICISVLESYTYFRILFTAWSH